MIRRTPIRRQSKKRAKEARVYSKLRLEFLGENTTRSLAVEFCNTANFS